MANTYTQLTIQYVFSVKGRENLIDPEHNKELQKYISGIIQNRKSKLIAINNMPDHIHILMGQNPSYSPAKMVQEIKNNSSRFINGKGWFVHRFEWQTGYGAFSYSHSHRDQVVKYIENQQKHHENISFKEEYMNFLNKFEIDFSGEYLFEFYE